MDRVSGILCVVKRALLVEGFGCLEFYSCTGGDMCVGFRHFRVSLACVTLKYWLYMCGKPIFPLLMQVMGRIVGDLLKLHHFYIFIIRNQLISCLRICSFLYTCTKFSLITHTGYVALHLLLDVVILDVVTNINNTLLQKLKY